MDGKFDVFDEYGRFIGRIVPSGQGAADSFFALLAIILLWIFGFLIYSLIRLIIEGFKALGKGDFGKAILCLAIPVAMVCSAVTLPAIIIVSEVRMRSTSANLTQRFDNLLASGGLVRITEESNQQLDGALCGTDYTSGCLEYSVKNITDDLGLWISDGFAFNIVVAGTGPWHNEILLMPGQEVTVYCATWLVLENRCDVHVKLESLRSVEAELSIP